MHRVRNTALAVAGALTIVGAGYLTSGPSQTQRVAQEIEQEIRADGGTVNSVSCGRVTTGMLCEASGLYSNWSIPITLYEDDSWDYANREDRP